MIKIILVSLFSILYSQYDYSLEDLNPSSNYYQENVGTSAFNGNVTLHYFGYFSWGLCTSRFGQLEDVYQSLLSNGYTQVNLVGVGSISHLNSLNNWTGSNDASVCADVSGSPVWNQWGASQRDLYVLDHEGNVILEQNISGGLPANLESTVIDLINNIPNDSGCEDGEMNYDDPCNPLECIDGEWYQIVIDCQEEMGIPCDEGIYVEPDPNECCSTCVQYGDSNQDGSLNVLDTVLLVNLVLQQEYDTVSDINQDNVLNVLDVVNLVSLILGN